MKKLIFLTLLSFQALADFNGKVVAIADGDTLTVLNAASTQIRVRLVEIDAPEKAQAFGDRSKQSLSDLCGGKIATIKEKGQDKYQRTLGRVICDGIDANAEQVRRGMAWAYTKYLTDQSIADLETAARSSRTGLWADSNAIAPWEFRHSRKQ